MELVFIQDDIANWTAQYLLNAIPVATIREVRRGRFVVKHIGNTCPPELHNSIGNAQLSLLENY